MREYGSPAAFRAAVEARLRERARRLGAPAYILRRQAALERLMVRLTSLAADRWALKGGLALDTRLGARARVSLDLDADHVLGAEAARADLQRAGTEDVGDHFAFAIAGTEELREAGLGLAVRYRLESSLAGRPFEPLQVDVSIDPPDPWDCSSASTAWWMSLCCETPSIVSSERRGTHDVPERLPTPPRQLAIGYRREAEHVRIAAGLEEAHQLLVDWLDPVLAMIHQARKPGPNR